MSEPTRQAPALSRRKVGEYVVTYLSDGFLDGAFGYLHGISEEDAKAMLAKAHRPPLAHFSIASYLLQGRGRTILIDAGTGGLNGWGGRFSEALAVAGVAPDDIDTVLLTHGHADHVGGLTRDGAPVFRKAAEVIINEADVRFWRDDAMMAAADDAGKPYFVVARAAFEAYKDKLRPVGAGEVAPGVELVPLPGHTPGHSGLRVSSGGEQLLIWADIAHMPDIQIARPEVTIGFDVDPAMAQATRKRVFDEVATDRITVAGMHLNLPGFLQVERHGAGYAKVDLPWTPALL